MCERKRSLRDKEYPMKRWDRESEDAAFLENLFKKKKISPSTKANAVRTKFPEKFMGYSTDAFRSHFNKMKATYGLMVNDRMIEEPDEENEKEMDIDTSLQNDESGSSSNNNSVSGSVGSVAFTHPCFLMASFEDPDSKLKKLQCVITPFVGVRNVNFLVDDSGKKAKLTFEWPRLITSEKNLFEDDINANKITHYHPKVLAIGTALKGIKSNIEETPHGEIEIEFPYQVQTGASSQRRKIVKSADGKESAIYIELSAHVEQYNVKVSDTKIELD